MTIWSDTPRTSAPGVGLAGPGDRQAWIITSILFLGQVINYMDKAVIGIAAVPIMHELELSPAQYGLVASSVYALFAVSGVLVGQFVAHRVSSKILLTGLVLIWSLSQLPIVLFSSFATLIVCRVILGIGEGPSLSVAVVTCHGWFPAERRNMPTAFIAVGSGVGSLLAGPILSYTIILYGWRAAFLLCGVLGFGWVALWTALGTSGPLTETAASPPHPATARRRIGQRAIWSDPTIIAVVIVTLCANWSLGFTLAWLAPLVRGALGYGAAATGWIIAAAAATNSAVVIAMSYVSQFLLTHGRSSRLARGAVTSLCLLGGGAALAAAAAVAGPVAKLALLALGGSLPLVSFTLCPAIVSEIVPDPERNRFMVSIFAGTTITAFASPIVSGRLIGNSGLPGYNAAMTLSAAALALSGLVGLWLLRPERSIRRFA